MNTIGHDTLTISQPREYSLERTNGANSMNEWRRTTFANSNFEIQNAAQLSVIKSQVSGVIRENANTAIFYRS